jgi:hypothetical protein
MQVPPVAQVVGAAGALLVATAVTVGVAAGFGLLPILFGDSPISVIFD